MRCRSVRVSAASAPRSRFAFPAPSPEQALQAVEREGAAEAERQREIQEYEDRKRKAAKAAHEEHMAAIYVLFPTVLPRPNFIRFSGQMSLTDQSKPRIRLRCSKKWRLG
jgi:hypothetical protein